MRDVTTDRERFRRVVVDIRGGCGRKCDAVVCLHEGGRCPRTSPPSRLAQLPFDDEPATLRTLPRVCLGQLNLLTDCQCSNPLFGPVYHCSSLFMYRIA